MCIIIAKPTKKSKPPALKTFQKAMQSNPHGFSIALKRPGVPWNTFRTMSAAAMVEWIQDNGVLRKSSVWIFHARIKTHGEPSLRNCHCWQDRMTGNIFAHNGILGIKADTGKTDSESYFRHIFMPLYRHEGAEAALKSAVMIANGHNKLAIVMPHEKKQIALVGDYIKKDGIYYSNNSAFEISYPAFYGCSQSLSDVSDWEFDRDYWARKAKSNAKKLLNNSCSCQTTQPDTKSPSPATRTATSSSTPLPAVPRSSTLLSATAPEPPWGS